MVVKGLNPAHRMNVNQKLIFNRYVELEVNKDPVLIRFEYDRLKKLCRRCESLLHENSVCEEIILHHLLPIVEHPAPINQHQEQEPDSENEDMEEPLENQ